MLCSTQGTPLVLSRVIHSRFFIHTLSLSLYTHTHVWGRRQVSLPHTHTQIANTNARTHTDTQRASDTPTHITESNFFMFYLSGIL